MATSTEQINDLIAGFTNLKTFFEGERSALYDARDNLPSKLHQVVYVDEANGLVGNPGSLAEPFASVDDALDAVPDNTSAQIRLLSNVTMRRVINSISTTFQIVGHDGTGEQDRVFTVAPDLNGDTTKLPQFVMGGGSAVDFRRLTLNLPQNDAAAAAVPLIKPYGFSAVRFGFSSIVGTGGTSPLLWKWDGLVGIQLQSSTSTDMPGRWVAGHPAGQALTYENTRGVLNAEILDNGV